MLAWEQFERLQGNDPGDPAAPRARAAGALDLPRAEGARDRATSRSTTTRSIPPDAGRARGRPPLRELRRAVPLLRDAARRPRRSSCSTRAATTSRSSRFRSGWAASSTERSGSRMDPDTGRHAGARRASWRTSSPTRSIRKTSGDRAPGWLHEGLAQWCEGRRLTAARFPRDLPGRPQARLARRDGGEPRPQVRARRGAGPLRARRSAWSSTSSSTAARARSSACSSAFAEGPRRRRRSRGETGLTGAELVAAWKAWAGASRPDSGSAGAASITRESPAARLARRRVRRRLRLRAGCRWRATSAGRAPRSSCSREGHGAQAPDELQRRSAAGCSGPSRGTRG